jgi:hypothetical protein
MLPMKSLTRAATFATFFFISGVSFADIPAFLILKDGVNFSDIVRSIELTGTRVRHGVPPRVVIVDLPKGTKPLSLPGVLSFYTSVVPVAELEPQGPAAVAAGLQWNRKQLSAARQAGPSAMGSMRVLVADRSLDAPVNVRLTAGTGRFTCEWNGVDGATYYEVQASASENFDSLAVKTNSVRTRVDLAAPESSDIYVRVRGIDPGDATATDDDVHGQWSQTVRLGGVTPLAAGGTNPTLTSPANQLETEGFTLILEWTPDSGPARVQMARDAGFQDTVFDEMASDGEYACPGPALRTGDRLYWRVQSMNGARSGWSSAREVRIGVPKSHLLDGFVNPEAPR